MTGAQLTYKVELDLSGGAFGAPFSATDVTSKAAAGLGFEPITVTWGRQDQYSDVNPTTVSGSLLNTDGTFTPGNNASIYYPRIRRLLRRRVSVGVNATTVNLSEDYATSIEVVPSHDGPATTQIHGSDILARFGQASSAQSGAAQSIGTTLRSFLAEEMILSNPACLYMLQEASGATSFADVTGNRSVGTVVDSKDGAGVVTAGQATASPFYGGTMVEFTNSAYGTWTAGSSAGSWVSLDTPDLSSYGAWAVEAWVQPLTTAPGANGAAIAASTMLTNNTTDFYGLRITSAGKVRFHYGQGNLFVESPNSILDGKAHHLIGTAGSFTEAILHVDGVATAIILNTNVAGPSAPFQLGMWNSPAGPQFPFSGSIGYFALYPTLISDASVHYNAGANAFSGERTDQRITRLLSYRANTGSSLDTGLGTMGIQDIAGRSLQDCLLEVGQVEAGAVYVDGTGRVNFRSRSRLFNPTPSVTLDMSVGGVEFGSNWREDTQNVRNDVTVTNSTTGSDQRVFNATSLTTDGEFSTSASLPLNADQDAKNLAGWMVVNGTQQQLTATPLIVNLLHLSAAQAQAVLQLKPIDCIQLTNCPTPAPSATQTFIVQGGTISLAADAAAVTLNLTPLPYPVGAWSDATYGRWACDGNTLNANITAGATSLAIATTAGKPTFTTDGTMYPLTIIIDNEQITLNSAPGGATSPQTFTGVTRGINAASHTAGASIDLYPLTTWAF